MNCLLRSEFYCKCNLKFNWILLHRILSNTFLGIPFFIIRHSLTTNPATWKLSGLAATVEARWLTQFTSTHLYVTYENLPALSTSPASTPGVIVAWDHRLTLLCEGRPINLPREGVGRQVVSALHRSLPRARRGDGGGRVLVFLTSYNWCLKTNKITFRPFLALRYFHHGFFC